MGAALGFRKGISDSFSRRASGLETIPGGPFAAGGSLQNLGQDAVRDESSQMSGGPLKRWSAGDFGGVAHTEEERTVAGHDLQMIANCD